MSYCHRRRNRQGVESMNKAKYYLAGILVLLVSLVALLPPATAADADSSAAPRVVRVGYSSSGSMLYRDSDGEYRGYDVLYLYEVARYTNWIYEFVPYDDWSKAVADVAAGRIDILPTVIKTPQREKEMLFSLYPMASSSIALIKREQDSRYVYGDIEGTRNALVGVRENTADMKLFREWASRNGISYQQQMFHDRGDLLAALRSGAIDIAATTYAGEAQHFPAITEFSPQPMYFAIAPQHPELAAQLDQAVSTIMIYDDNFFNSLQRLMQLDKRRYKVMVSDRERAYIDSLPPLRVALLRDKAPFSYEKDDKMHGITVKVLNRLAALTGLQFEFVIFDSYEQAKEALLNNDVQLLGTTNVNHIATYRDGIRTTTPYYQECMAILMRRGTDGRHIATSENNAELLRSSDMDYDCEIVDNASEALKMLQERKVDAMACDMATASYYAGVLHRGDYELSLLTDIPDHVALAMRKDADPQLGFLLDRTMKYLNDAEINDIAQKEINRAPMSFANILSRLDSVQIGIIVFLGGIMYFALIYFVWSLWHSRRLERRVRQAERDYGQVNSSLAMEKQLAASQRKFYRYIDGNIMAPVRILLLDLIRRGGADQDSPLHKDYLNCGMVNSFMVDVNFLNRLLADEVTMNEWQPVGVREILQQLGGIIANSAQRKNVAFTMDFSGIGQERVIIDKRFFSMTMMRLFSLLLKSVPAGTGLLLSGSLSRMAGDERHQCVLWLFCHAPKLIADDGVLHRAQNMLESIHHNPRSIYELLAQSGSCSLDERMNTIHIAIIELLIMMLGGEWHIQHSPDKGTEVTVELLLDIDED